MNYNLERFTESHKKYYPLALQEIKNGYKESHWMWFIFPQIAGLGSSEISKYYAIRSLDEARAYMQDKLLCTHMLEICEALLKLETNDAEKIFGWPDNMKLKSSMTLFAMANPEKELFKKVLSKFFNGQYDERTQRILL